MAEPDYTTMTDEQLLQAAHAAGVDSASPSPPAPPTNVEMSTGEKVGLGAAATGAGVLALKYPALRGLVEQALARSSNAAHEVPLWKQAGLRTAEDAPIARNLAGSSGMEALQDHTREVSRTIGANEAGIAAEQEPHLSQDVLADARREPDAVYDRVAIALPPGPLSPEAQQALTQGGLPGAGRVSEGSPQAQVQIERLRQQLLAPTNAKGEAWTGQNWVNELRGLRQEGFTNVASDDISNQQLGRAQLDFSRAIEGHILDSVPPELKDQFLAARKTLAKNATIQQALRGNDIDLQVLARIQRNDPQLLDGGTKLLADFAATHPEVASLPSKESRYNPPSFARDLQSVRWNEPSTWVRPFVGAAARSSLVGDKDAAIAAANQQFPAKSASAFLPPAPPPTPKFGGYLPAPATVNAGGGATTESALRELGLTPDVQAAGLQHPATARLQALREQLMQAPERSAQSVDFQGPQKWGDFSITPTPQAGPVRQGEIPFENVLEQGGTQGKPVAGIQSGYRPAPQSPKGPNMRTPPGAPELTEFSPHTPSDAQMAFRNQQAADRLRKVAGDLRMEGPGGNEGSPLDRIRAALERRDRGYAEGGPVQGSSSPASPGVGGALKDAWAALRDYMIETPRRRLQSEREGIENTVVDDTAEHAPVSSPQENYADGGGVPSIAQQEAIAQATRQLADLVSTHEGQQAQSAPQAHLAGGGRVELIEKIGQYLDKLAQERAARNAALGERAPKLPLVQSPDDPALAAATNPPATPPAAPSSPLQPGFLTSPQAKADGGSVDDTQSSIRRLADAARALDNPSGTDPNAENRARVATNLASLAYGLDSQGNPALGGRAWTNTQGGTPIGVLDAITSMPHNLVQTAKLVDHYLPGQSNPKFWDSIDPQWSAQAVQRLGQLRQRIQQAAKVAPASNLKETVMDVATDPEMVVPLGVSKLARKGSALQKALGWGTGGAETPATQEH